MILRAINSRPFFFFNGWLSRCFGSILRRAIANVESFKFGHEKKSLANRGGFSSLYPQTDLGGLLVVFGYQEFLKLDPDAISPEIS